MVKHFYKILLIALLAVVLPIVGIYAWFIHTSIWQYNADFESYEAEFQLVCDYVLDNGGVAGDASVQLPGLSQNIAPTSSVIDLTLVNLIMVNIVERMLEKGMNPPLFMSSNSDGGDKANKSVLEVYRERIPSL